MPRTPARFTQADVARAIRAVQAAGVEGWCVTIKPDGAITIEPASFAESRTGADESAKRAGSHRPRIPL